MKRALIVDDIKENLYLLESLLKGYGYATVTASNGAEALGLALKEPPDIIIADILMPVMDGYTLCREWKKDKVLKNIPFVFYTATYTHPKDGEFAMSLGADKFIIKPQEPEDFMAMIEQVLSEFRNGKIPASQPPELSEISMLKEYNETLIRKMEDRMLKSEEAEKKIRIYATQLEQEIEQREQAEQALKESEERYRLLFNNSMDAVLLTNPNGTIIQANAAACTIFGKTEDEITRVGRNGIIDITDPRLEIALKERLQNGKFSGELTGLRKDGSKFPIEISSALFHDNNGNLRSSMIIRDISERLQAQEALRKSAAIQQKMVANIGDVIAVIDQNGINRYKSPNIEKWFGWKPEEVVGASTWNLVHAEDLESSQIFFAKLFREPDSSGTTELRYRCKDGSYKWIEFTAVNLLDDPDIKGILGNYHDISERKQVEQQLIKARVHAEESDRLKSAFLANMSHEIRTPMNGILGFAELLKEPNLTGEQQHDYIEIIEKSGARMLNIINDIVDISKIESGQMKVLLKGTNVNEQMEFIYKLFNREVEQKGLHLSLKKSLSPSEAIIETDREKIFAILTNLIKNAIKYTDQGTIEFGCGPVETRLIASLPPSVSLQFYVKDTGIGIPGNRHEAIFERFIQADTLDKMARQGAGLGLAISKAYVEMLGGKIGVESEEGKGSTFYFTIPYHTEPKEEIVTEHEALTPIEKTQMKKVKILIVEDDEPSSQLISFVTRKFVDKIIYAQTGTEAVQTCFENPDIDLILMDIQMPEMDGYEATRKIRQFNTDVIIIAQTAYALSGDKEKAIDAGCNDYISKPIRREVILELMQKYFNKMVI